MTSSNVARHWDIATQGYEKHDHPVQRAIVEHDGAQCGFCTPGFVVAAKAVLELGVKIRELAELEAEVRELEAKVNALETTADGGRW